MLFSSCVPLRDEAVASLTCEASHMQQHASQPAHAEQARLKNLPRLCPGCGAPSQTVDNESAGYYGPRRVQKALRGSIERGEDAVFNDIIRSGALAEDGTLPAAPGETSPGASICDRCHYLLYQSRGNSIIHPSMDSIRQIIEESPHKYNHIYHILDAADFPMSLIPNLAHKLALPRMRTRNRRSRQIEYVRGRQAEVSFIISRADLLAPQKELVDRMLPQLREMLRDALGRTEQNVRLGNVRCVSAQRGWWTPTVKEDIWTRGGAGWMVGKVNVGKSALFQVVFPKGRQRQDNDINKLRAKEAQALDRDAFAKFETLPTEALEDAQVEEAAPESFGDSPGDLSERSDGSEALEAEPYQESQLQYRSGSAAVAEIEQGQDVEDYAGDEGSDLLPPARQETAFPDMPLVSSLPGTTASPIRIPFGNGKGELIDLPGIHRSSLDTYVRPEHRKSMIMKSRIKPEQHSIKPGQSILIGGMIRITPQTDNLVFLAYPFVPLDPHVTSTAKAIAVQTGYGEDGEAYSGTVPTIATDEAKQSIQSAGTFRLDWNVTKTRSGPLTSSVAGKMKVDNLPFIVYSADLLIEGVGWVELVCQVRKRRDAFTPNVFGKQRRDPSIRDAFDDAEGGSDVPEVEVFTPKGQFVGVRRPLNAWTIAGPNKTPKHKMRGRPRMSISFQKRKEGGRKGGTARTQVEEG